MRPRPLTCCDLFASTSGRIGSVGLKFFQLPSPPVSRQNLMIGGRPTHALHWLRMTVLACALPLWHACDRAISSWNLPSLLGTHITCPTHQTQASAIKHQHTRQVLVIDCYIARRICKLLRSTIRLETCESLASQSCLTPVLHCEFSSYPHSAITSLEFHSSHVYFC